MRKLLWIVLALAFVIGGIYLGRRIYVSARQTSLTKQAKEYIAAGDDKNALLCLRRIIDANSHDAEAYRLMAQIAEANRSPNALTWRTKVLELNPTSFADQLALARIAVASGQYLTASNVLAQVAPANRKTVQYHTAMGTLEMLFEPNRAVAEFTAALQLMPNDPTLQFSLAMSQLSITNSPQLQAAGRAKLQELSTKSSSPAVRCQSLRQLIDDALRNKQPGEALTLVRQLLADPGAEFQDWLLRLGVLQATKNSGFQSTLAATERVAATNLVTAFDLGTWEQSKISPNVALNWLQSLPPGIQTNQPVALLMAQCRDAVADWRNLQATLERQKWGDLEFFRHAFLARALRGQNLEGAAKAEWEIAIRQVNGDKDQYGALLHLAAGWNWAGETEELCWAIVNQFPDEWGVVQTLTRTLYASGRTRALLTLYFQQAKRFPDNADVNNNLAMAALLLDAQEYKPAELAERTYKSNPTNPDFASTYAFSLYLQKRYADALKVMSSIKPEALENDQLAGYYGLVLAANGDMAKAKHYLMLGLNRPDHPPLPEERKLFERALNGK